VTTSPDDQQELEKEIERTREQLGETVEALAAKVDVKTRTQEKLSQLTARLKGKAPQAGQQIRKRPAPVAATASGILSLVLFFIFVRRWRRR
jgi:septal ring factor EnvC (AmiA/AmiB activator)